MKKKNRIIMLAIAVILITIAPMQTVAAQGGAVPYQKEYADGYSGGTGIIREESESTYYTYKNDVEYSIPYGVPTYFDGTAAPNACAVNCGSVVIGYYNRQNNLIPGFAAGRTAMGIFRWNAKNELVQSMITSLYSLMRTDPNPGGGTTVENYKTGISQYVTGRGYSTAITSRMSSTDINYNQTMQSIQNGKLVTLFMGGYTVFLDVRSSGNTDTIHKGYYAGNHVVVAYGYREIHYYDSAYNLIKHHRYLKIYTSIPDMSTGFIKLNDGCVVDDAYEIFVSQ